MNLQVAQRFLAPCVDSLVAAKLSITRRRDDSPLKTLNTLKILLALFIPFFTLSNLAFSSPLRWEDCLKEAKENNAALSAAKRDLEAARYNKSGSYGPFLPQISGGLTYSKEVSATDSSYGASLTATQNLFSGFLDEGKMRQAEASVKNAEALLQGAKATLSYDLKVSYSGLYIAQRSYLLRQEIVKRRQANSRLVELSYESGRENWGSVLLSKAYLEQAKYDLLQTEADLRTLRRDLGRVMNKVLPDDAHLETALPVTSPGAPPDFQSLVLSTVDYQTSVSRENAAEGAFRTKLSGLLPSLSVTAAKNYVGNNFFPENDRLTLGATLTIPLFAGGKDFHETLGASESKASAALNKQLVLKVGLFKLEKAFADFQLAEQKLIVDKTFLEAVRVRAKISRQKYNNGLLTFDNWDLIENDLIAREKTALQSERDRATAEAAWELAKGKGVVP